MDESSVAKAILKLAEVHNQRGGEIATALDSIARQLKSLGTGNAASEMGALESLGKEIHEGLGSVASALSEVSNSLDR